MNISRSKKEAEKIDKNAESIQSLPKVTLDNPDLELVFWMM